MKRESSKGYNNKGKDKDRKSALSESDAPNLMSDSLDGGIASLLFPSSGGSDDESDILDTNTTGESLL